jgi:8-oxo-dGTP pyrophosphatase MutT (NUDIX family)
MSTVQGRDRNVMLPKRDTRVQLFIIENGRYIMLQHHIKQKGLFVWGLPGGGMEPGETHEETAHREAFEETGLKIRLMPTKFKRNFEDSPVYKRAVTFIAIPVDGNAVLGEEPEEEMKDYYALTGIKWQDLNDRDLSPLAIKNTQPILEWILSKSVLKAKNYIVVDTNRRSIFTNESGGIFHDGNEARWEYITAISKLKATLKGNIVLSDGNYQYETTFVHEAPYASLENFESGQWIKASEAGVNMENLGVARYLKMMKK